MRVVSAGGVNIAVLVALVVMVEAANVLHYYEPTRMNEAASRPHYFNQAPYEQAKQDVTQAHTEETGPSKFRHISSLDMDIPGQDCPPSLILKEISSHRLCQRALSGPRCGSVIIPTGGQSYTKVRGRVTGYVFRTVDGFASYDTIDDAYVDGVSITYGSPRKHIWTYAAAYGTIIGATCPEIGNTPNKQPAFVGKNFICALARNYDRNTKLYNSPLWTTLGNCVGDCPDDLHFCVTLDQPTTEDLELRICTDQIRADEDVYIKSFDFYIQ